LAAVRLLDGRGVIVAGPDIGLSHMRLPEVQHALAGHSATVLRTRVDDPYGLHSPLEWLSRALTIRVHHVRPVTVGGQVIGAVMLSRSPRGLFVGIYQDRGKIALGVLLILLTLIILSGLLSRGIARPIRELTRASNDVARGDVIIPETPATAAVEIRDLYANFAAMAERIQARERYLRDFAAAVSHEFKTPLTGIRGALELLAEHDMAEGERQRFLSNAAADADRLSRLVQRLLDLARADMTGYHDGGCDPAGVARELAEGSSDIAIRSEAGLPEVAIPAETLATVLTILIENSRQAGARSIEIDARRANGHVTIHCTDDGPGIACGDRQRIFEPFFTGRRASGGTGLGLPIAQSLLAAAKASIALVETERRTTFVLTLPVRT
jgi:signal transduction histidine kinase